MRSLTVKGQLEMSGTSRNLNNSFLRCSKWGWLLLLVIAFMMPFCAQAQLSGRGTITGTVSDSTGAVIPGATVTATNNANGITNTTTTTGAGDYNFPNLDPGIYTVTTSAKGFEKLTQKGIHVNAMESQTYNPVLTVGGSSIEITVTTALPQLETSNATVGSTMENEVYAELPIEMGAYGQTDQRRATDFAFLMPGVQGNNTTGNPTTNTGVVNGSGSRGAASAVYVDGVVFVRAGGNGDPRYVWTAISVDAIDQFQVQTTGYSAVYEGQGVMNYTVKQGGAKQHGSVYEFIRNTAFDTWGFLAKAPNPATGVPVKPVEHSNEYGINLSGPLVPFGKWKQKVFYYGNYNGFRYSAATPTPITFPTPNEQAGNFTLTGTYRPTADSNGPADVPIYDPSSQAACTAHQTHGYPCRYQYGYTAPTSPSTKGTTGAGVATGPLNVIPTGEISPITAAMQALLPRTGISSALSNNYIAPNATGLVNWSTTDRIDFLPTSSDTLAFIFADGRQASSNPVGQTTAGRNVGPVPFNYGQTYAPKTAVGIIEETHVFTPHLINQAKWGYARYNGPTFNPATAPQYAPSNFGMSFANTTPSGVPVAGQAVTTFPIVPFTGTNSPTTWGGSIANVTVAENYTAMDNLQWTVGKHSFTFGTQFAWLLYNTIADTGGTTPMVLASAVTETSAFKNDGTTSVASGTGSAYASFLLGQIDSASGKNNAPSTSTFTYTDSSAHPEFGARFRPVSFYVQDNWKIMPKLTLDLGLRYDFFPSVREVHDDGSFFDPNLANPSVGNLLGALNFTGHGTGTCNCDSPVNNYHKNIGPRLGLAYQLNPKTVVRSSWGVMYTHGDAVGGLASTLGTLGFSASPSMSSSKGFTAMTGLLNGNDVNPTTGLSGTANNPTYGTGIIPAYAAPQGVASGPGYGTGYNGSNSSKPSGSTYDDPYLGGRAPEYINWTLGIQRQVTNALAFTATYVGSEGHFLQLDSNMARGVQSNQLDPKYLVLGSHLTDTNTSPANGVTTDCGAGGAVAAAGFSCNSTALANFNSGTALSALLQPYPFEAPADSFGYVGNANYHALQAIANLRAYNGLTINASYTYGRAIDDGGSFRSGYAIPAGALANNPTASYPVDRIERTVSTSNQKNHFVLTTVWDWPLGKTVLNNGAMERAILGGFKFSGVYQQFSGSPLAITESATQTNPAQNGGSTSSAPAILNPQFYGQNARQNGRWGKGATYSNYNTLSYIVPSTGTTPANATGPFMNPVTSMLSSYNYMFSDAPRTAPYNLVGPGTYQLDLAAVRSFPLHITQTSKLDFRAEWYNVTNHTFWSVASTALGNSTFGTVTPSGSNNRKAAQFSGRIEF
jgi:hypothetical protein